MGVHDGEFASVDVRTVHSPVPAHLWIVAPAYRKPTKRSADSSSQERSDGNTYSSDDASEPVDEANLLPSFEEAAEKPGSEEDG